jgi:hypothetical protein
VRLDRKKRRLRVGDRVRFYLGERRVRAQVVGSSSHFGCEQIVRVRLRGGTEIEIRAEQCTK